VSGCLHNIYVYSFVESEVLLYSIIKKVLYRKILIKGVSGGPFVCKEKGKRVIRGVIGWRLLDWLLFCVYTGLILLGRGSITLWRKKKFVTFRGVLSNSKW